MSDRPAADRLLAALPRLVLVVGKGGAGKTTCAAALALRADLLERSPSAERRAPRATLLLSTDPAGTLADALEVPLGAEPAVVPGTSGLYAFRIDAAALRADFLARWRDVLVAIMDRGTYLDVEDIGGLIDDALPGGDEVFALLRLAELARDARWARIIVDTAPTGHTLRLLALPRTIEALVALLDAMQEKHRFMVHALVRRYRADDADAFIARMRGEVAELRATLADPARAAAIVVTRDEPIVLAESDRLLDALRVLPVRVAAVVTNAATRSAPLAAAPSDALRLVVPRLAVPPVGREGLARWADALRLADAADGATTPTMRPVDADGDLRATGRDRTTAVDLESLVRPLTIVGGKGGVGKTTVACALAVATASLARPTLLVSTDPAPSVGDALGLDVPDADTPVAEVPGLVARQMDASAAFERMRSRYQSRIDELFDAFAGRGVDAAYDRAILRELLALAPPGVDEVYALADLGATLAEGRFTHVIVDPAPTGHLLRLLDMPALALDWTHRLMRLVLKYRELGALDGVAEELLAFARRTRAVQALLHDASRAALLVVATDEPLVRAETARLLAATHARGIGVSAVLWNRADAPGAPLSSDDAALQLSAPLTASAPVGVAALRRWTERWTRAATPESVA